MRLAIRLFALALAGIVTARASPVWTARLQEELSSLDSGDRAAAGVYVRDLDSGDSVSHRDAQRWYLASMVKVPVAITILRAIEQGRLSLDTTVTLRASDYVDGAGATNQSAVGAPLTIRFLLEQMIIYSDNTATDVLIDLVGAAEVNAVVKALVPDGFERITRLGEVRQTIYGKVVPNVERLSGKDLLLLRAARSDSERVTLLRELVKAPAVRHGAITLDSAFDSYYAEGLNSGRLDAYGELLALLVDGKALSAQYTDYLLDLMQRVATGKHRIKAGLPSTVRFAHKTGTQRRRVCDAGVARWQEFGRPRRVLIVACTQDLALERAEAVLKQVGLAVCRSGVFSSGVRDVSDCPSAEPVDRVPAPRR